jgi:hypothetical protein
MSRDEDIPERDPRPFQQRVIDWFCQCFGKPELGRKGRRNNHFLEEAVELSQSLDMSEEEAISIVRYVYSRPKGAPRQEVGGVMTTLAILCTVHELDMNACGENELARIWTCIDKIREKQKHKPH